MAADWDLIVIGGDVARLTAGLLARRGGLKTLLVEKQLVGGQLVNGPDVEYFPGFAKGVNGMELVRQTMTLSARDCGPAPTVGPLYPPQ